MHKMPFRIQLWNFLIAPAELWCRVWAFALGLSMDIDYIFLDEDDSFNP